MLQSVIVLGSLAVLALGASMALAQDAAAQTPPVKLNAEQDHRRMLDLLGIKSLRQGVDGMNPKAPNAANYDEAKANPYPKLPELLVTKDGKKVTTPEMWEQRRAEILEDFDREVYGRTPENTPKVNWVVKETTNEKRGNYPAITKKLAGQVDNSSYPLINVNIDMTLTTPADAKGPVPVIIEFGFIFPNRRPATGASRPSTNPATRPGFPGTGPGAGPNWQEQILAKGWGYAILYPYTVQADNGGGLTEGIIGLCNKGQPRDLDDWGALKAWAWGASRALDYMETDPAVDAKMVGIEGLSRFGKAALVTMAYDPRFAIAFVGSSGAGGAKLHRRNAGEVVENVAASGEYHWMAGNYLKYAGPLTWDDLPVDSHQLIALCAPRPVFIGTGIPQQGDGWVDARGMFMAAVAASPAWELLGKKGLATDQMPAVDAGLLAGELAWRQHSGGHTNGPNWATFLNFAEKYFSSPKQ